MLCYECQAKPLIRLAARHSALGKEDKVTSFVGWIIEQLHQLNTVTRDAITHCRGIFEILSWSFIALYRVSIIEVQLTEGL